MTLDIQTFVPRPETVRAVQVTAENVEAVAEWSDWYTMHTTRRALRFGVISLGRWMVKHSDSWFCLSDAEFHRRYQPAPAAPSEGTSVLEGASS